MHVQIPVTVHQARLGPQEFQVVRPALPPRRALLLDEGPYLNAYVDQEAARLLAGLWSLAATSPRSLIHVPLRPAGAGSPEPGSRPLDLVLLHHSLQFAPSRWKELRGRLGPGRRRSVSAPASEPEIDYEALRHAENRDRFHQHLHAETLFMTGSAKVFRETAGHFREVARHGPAHVRDATRHGHYCARLHCGDTRTREIHIEYDDSWPDVPA
ncbi:hypothetical protein ACFYZ4_18550 [Streptomyces sp. NPDC001513]|uniref:hypothetical protein n=1 Tax=Streptomyces sp. NPDC001513 TaxID=3364580 RepID=UPI00368C9119